MSFVYSIYDLPKTPAVYAMYGGRKQKHVAYVGIGSNLHQRLNQHFIRRDSSVSTGTSAAGINPDYVSEVVWWEHESFSEKNVLKAAELVAFEVFEPALRSRGNTPADAIIIFNENEFKENMSELFNGDATGTLILPNLEYLHEKIIELEKRVEFLE